METSQFERSVLWKELRAIVAQGCHVWELVPARHKLTLGFATIIVIATSISNTAVTLLLGELVDHIKTHVDSADDRNAIYHTTFWLLGIISGIYLLREGLHVIRRQLVESVCSRINCDMQTRLVSHMLTTNLACHAFEKVGAQQGKIVRCVDGLVRFMRLMFLDCMPAIFTGLFALSAAITKKPLLGIVMMGVAPISIWITIRQLSTQKNVRLRLMRDCEEIDGTIGEQLAGVEFIRAANTNWLEMQRLAAATEKKRRLEMEHHYQMSLYGCGKAINEGFFHVIVLGIATYLAINQKVSYGDILVFSVLYMNVMSPLNEIHRILDEGHEASLRVADLVDLLEQPVDCSYHASANESLILEMGKPAIEIKNLVVDYAATENQMRRALDGISLTILHGETIGVAGPSGSGKSTWIKVLLRLLHPTSGSVSIAGVPLEHVGRAEIARVMGYVGQNPFVFSGTIVENISYGRHDIDSMEMVHAATLANLHEEILQMPGSYSAEVSEGGRNLSGGQRQRLAIARILIKQSPILILDEATSALDNISERWIQQALGVTNKDRTTILIAHRLSTLRHCDRILIFDEGKIVEMGSYEELLTADGLFARLVQSAEKDEDETVYPANVS